MAYPSFIIPLPVFLSNSIGNHVNVMTDGCTHKVPDHLSILIVACPLSSSQSVEFASLLSTDRVAGDITQSLPVLY